MKGSIGDILRSVKKVQAMLDHELNLIGKLKYEPYFLTVHDIVSFARSRNILCQGRGSAANQLFAIALALHQSVPKLEQWFLRDLS